ncbi:MAG: hypothetical protein BWX74_00071 [Tenericutes bacterium ADurb.Bin087]|nr:MAG: hypothetical protein BWX74_00071 [Tenericutes bacterium ADurb.Bin087]
MNKARRKTLILITMNLLILLGILVSFTGFTVAWFANVRNAQVHLTTIEVTAPDFYITEYNVYPVTSMTKGPTTSSFTFANTPALEMPKYDPNDIAYSQYQRALVVHATYEYGATSNTVFGAKTTVATFTTGTTGSNPYDDNYTSNIYQFTPSPGITLADSWSSATISTTNADAECLVTLSPTPVKATSTTIATLYAGSSTLWFVIEYNEAIMNYINTARASEIREVVYADDIIYYIGDGAAI